MSTRSSKRVRVTNVTKNGVCCPTCTRSFSNQNDLQIHQQKRLHLRKFHCEKETDIPFLYDFGTLVNNRQLFVSEGEKYFASCSNGFAKLYTPQGLAYWLAQASTEYTQDDWKIHFSVQRKHVGRAFDIISRLFLLFEMPFGMKAVSSDNTSWPMKMTGREITVYLYTKSKQPLKIPIFASKNHSKPFKIETIKTNPSLFNYKNMSANANEWKNKIHAFDMYDLPEENPIPLHIMKEFVIQCETLLNAAGIQSAGLADGDKAIGKFASIRNERFVHVINESGVIEKIYPPNCMGWNASHFDSDKSSVAENFVKQLTILNH